MNNIPQSAFWVKINKPVLFYDYIGENVKRCTVCVSV